MKITATIVLLFASLSVHNLCQAQQWDGSSNTDNDISRIGRVVLGYSDITLLTDGSTFTDDFLYIKTVGGGVGYQGGFSASSAITIASQFPNTYLSIGCGGEGSFRIGRSSNTPRIKLFLDANTIAAGDFNAIGRVVIGEESQFTKGFPNGYRMYVANGILTEKVRVAIKTSDDWADHVFSPGYQLRRIEDVGKYVQENCHLPEVPSADEVVKEGIDLAQMNAILLKKVEELTLYMLELNKKYEKLDAELRLLKK